MRFALQIPYAWCEATADIALIDRRRLGADCDERAQRLTTRSPWHLGDKSKATATVLDLEGVRDLKYRPGGLVDATRLACSDRNGRRYSGTRMETTKHFCQGHRGNAAIILSPEVLISNPCWEATTDALARFRVAPRDKRTPSPCDSPHSIPRQTSV